MSEAKKSSQANSYVVVSRTVDCDKVIGSWSNKDKAVRQAFETPGMTAIHVFNPVTGEMLETITKG